MDRSAYAEFKLQSDLISCSIDEILPCELMGFQNFLSFFQG